MSDVVETAPVAAVDTAPVESTAPVETEIDPLDVDLPGESQEMTKAEQKELKRILKLKVDGREIEEDISDEAALTAKLQKAYAAEKRMAEAAEERKRAEAVLRFLKEDTEGALKELGIDPEEFSEKLIEKRLKELEMSPEEKERQEMQRKLKEYEEREEKLKQEKLEQEKLALQQRYQQELDQKLTDALKNHPDLPQSDYSVKRIVNELIKYTKAGIDVDVEDVIPMVKENINKELRQMMSAMDDDKFEKWFGEDGFNRVRSIRKKKLGSAQKAPETLSTMKMDVAKAENKPREEKKLKAQDFFKQLEKDPTAIFKKK